MKQTKITGTAGENLAVMILIQKNYVILTTNYKTRYGEIDIIALKDDTLVFCEVKTRTGDFFGRGRDAVNRKKKAHIWNSAMEFLSNNAVDYKYIEFHVIEIMITHIIDTDPKGETNASYY